MHVRKDLERGSSRRALSFLGSRLPYTGVSYLDSVRKTKSW